MKKRLKWILLFTLCVFMGMQSLSVSAETLTGTACRDEIEWNGFIKGCLVDFKDGFEYGRDLE